MKVLLVGSTGLLGGAVLRRLTEAKVKVRALVRREEQAMLMRHANVEAVVGDLTDSESLTRACHGVTHVITTANAFLGSGRNSSKRVDLDGNLKLVDAAQRAGVQHFIFVSAVIASPDSITDMFRYKHLVEEHIKKSGMDYVFVRPSAFMEIWADIVAGSIPTKGVATIFGDGTNPINFVAVDDVADFIMLVLDNPAVEREAFAVGGPENLTLMQVAETFERHFGKKAKRKHIPVLAMQVLRRVLAFHEPTARKMSAGIEMARTPQAMDIRTLQGRFPEYRPKSLNEWLSSRAV